MKRRGHFFKGQMAVVMTFAIATLLGAMALGTDVAVMYFNWVQLQKGADAAALAGAFYLIPNNSKNYPLASIAAGCANAQAVNQTSSDDPARAACTYAVKNNMVVNDANDLKIYEPGINLPASAPTPNIQVWVNRSNLPYLFGKVIGLNTYSVSAKATGQDSYVGSFTGGLFPVLLQCKDKCTDLGQVSSGFFPGGTVTFGAKFGDVGASGNWQFLNIGGVGGSNLGNQIAGGAGVTDLTIGNTVNTKTGITWGPIQAGWNTRMASHNSMCASGSLPKENCSDPSANCSMSPIPSNDPLLVTVPAGDLTGCTGSCGVTITGFAQVYLYSLSKKSSTITLSGCFVQQVNPNGGSGGVANAPNLGAIAPPTLIQ